ncbi:hypothetical protein JWG44_07360 [Leptospira sp. 201903071]|uniref:hypothetical protein n=1 Tax=Leptospira ainazelensis TaxID=2810034 RepID=UPI001965443E|nr:hypothetical protein [Leptospira ainazelensis]MBM9500065.1 hypothetical protein [Leptospira ainazelensis]
MQLLEEKQTEAKGNHLLTCTGCRSKVTQLYQYDLCKSCLSKTFQRLIKVIDSVRK